MASIDFDRLASAPGLLGRARNAITRVRGMVADWQDARATKNDLSKLSDHELDDLGFVRGDLDDISRS